MSTTLRKPLGCARCRAVKLTRALGLTSATVDTDDALNHIMRIVGVGVMSIGPWLDKRETLDRTTELRIVDAMERLLARRTNLSASELPRDTPHADDCCADDETHEEDTSP